MAFQFVTQPQSVLVPQNATSVFFNASAIDPDFKSRTVTYQWRRKDTGVSTSYVNIAAPAGINSTLELKPLTQYDNDTFVVLVSTTSVAQALTSNEVTFGIRLSGDSFSNFETLTESGPNRRRRLVALGYV
jgi:hypothetical protein